MTKLTVKCVTGCTKVYGKLICTNSDYSVDTSVTTAGSSSTISTASDVARYYKISLDLTLANNYEFDYWKFTYTENGSTISTPSGFPSTSSSKSYTQSSNFYSGDAPYIITATPVVNKITTPPSTSYTTTFNLNSSPSGAITKVTANGTKTTVSGGTVTVSGTGTRSMTFTKPIKNSNSDFTPIDWFVYNKGTTDSTRTVHSYGSSITSNVTSNDTIGIDLYALLGTIYIVDDDKLETNHTSLSNIISNVKYCFNNSTSTYYSKTINGQDINNNQGISVNLLLDEEDLTSAYSSIQIKTSNITFVDSDLYEVVGFDLALEDKNGETLYKNVNKLSNINYSWINPSSSHYGIIDRITKFYIKIHVKKKAIATTTINFYDRPKGKCASVQYRLSSSGDYTTLNLTTTPQVITTTSSIIEVTNPIGINGYYPYGQWIVTYQNANGSQTTKYLRGEEIILDDLNPSTYPVVNIKPCLINITLSEILNNTGATVSDSTITSLTESNHGKIAPYVKNTYLNLKNNRSIKFTEITTLENYTFQNFNIYYKVVNDNGTEIDKGNTTLALNTSLAWISNTITSADVIIDRIYIKPVVISRQSNAFNFKLFLPQADSNIQVYTIFEGVQQNYYANGSSVTPVYSKEGMEGSIYLQLAESTIPDGWLLRHWEVTTTRDGNTTIDTESYQSYEVSLTPVLNDIISIRLVLTSNNYSECVAYIYQNGKWNACDVYINGGLVHPMINLH